MSTKSLAKYHGSKSVTTAGKSAGLVLDGRAFHVADYRRYAAVVKASRLDKSGNRKPAGVQERVDMMAAAMAAVFEADAHEFGCPFSPGYFIAGTQ